jgi:hypothetical protein
MGLPSRHIGCSSWSRSIHLLLLLFLCEALALSSSALEEVQGEQEEAATTTTRAETATVQGASASRAHHNYGVVVKKREEACVVGGGEGEGDGDAFRARYCVELYLKDVGARRNHLHSLRWLRLEHVNLLLPGDASGPIGTRMVLSFSSNKHRSSHDGDVDDRHHHPLVSADLLSRIELLLKEIVGGAALGWERHGPSVQQHQQQQQQQQQRQQQQGDVGALKEIREVLLFETNWFHPDGCSSCKIALLNRVVVLQGNSGFGGFLISVSVSVALSMCFFSLHWDFCVCIFGVSASSPSVPGIWFLYP